MDGCSRSFAPFYRCPCIIQQESDSTSTKSFLLLLLLLIIIIIIHKSPWSPFRQPRRQGSWSLLTAFGRILCITLLGALLGAVLGAGLSWDPEIRRPTESSKGASNFRKQQKYTDFTTSPRDTKRTRGVPQQLEECVGICHWSNGPMMCQPFTLV